MQIKRLIANYRSKSRSASKTLKLFDKAKIFDTFLQFE